MSEEVKPEDIRRHRKRAFLKGAAVHFASKGLGEEELKPRLQKLSNYFDSAAKKWDDMKAAIVGDNAPAKTT